MGKLITDEFIKNLTSQIEDRLPKNGKLIYLTLGGAHLFGLDTENSDVDIKGLFLPSTIDTKAQKPEHINLSTNKSNIKNTIDDIDIEVFSIYKYFDMLKVGDTNAYDLLFSMFQEKSILTQTTESNILKNHFKELLSSNSKAFLGYVVAQTKKYGVKGERYKVLTDTKLLLDNYVKENNIDIEKDNITDFIRHLSNQGWNYIKLIDRSIESKREGIGYYVEILNKEYENTCKFDYFLELIDKRLENYGERSKSASKGVDFKSLSHAYRIILEFEELLDTHFIQFPLQKADEILKVKKGNLEDFDNDYTKILNILDKKVVDIETKILECGLPDFIHPLTFNKLIVLLISNKN